MIYFERFLKDDDAEWQMNKPFKMASRCLRFRLKGAFQRFRLQCQALHALEPAKTAPTAPVAAVTKCIGATYKPMETAQVPGFKAP